MCNTLARLHFVAVTISLQQDAYSQGYVSNRFHSRVTIRYVQFHIQIATFLSANYLSYMPYAPKIPPPPPPPPPLLL